MAYQWSARITSISLELVVPGMVGYWLDRRWGTLPLLVIVGVILGFVTSFLSLLRLIKPPNSGHRPNWERADMTTWMANLRNCGVALRLAVLGTVVLAAWGLAAPVAVHLGGLTGLAAATIAAGLCLAGAAAALAIAGSLQGPSGVLAALWLGMLLRMGVPFGAGLAIHLHGGPLAQAGLLWYLLVFYPITLIVGTVLSLPPKNRRPLYDKT
jgi:hypothetical protein